MPRPVDDLSSSQRAPWSRPPGRDGNRTGRLRRLVGLAAALATMLATTLILAPGASAARGNAPSASDSATVNASIQKASSRPAQPNHEGEDHDEEPAVEPYKVLLFTQTTGFRHDDGIAAGIAEIQALGAANNFTVDQTEDSTKFTTGNLAQYRTVIFLSTTSPNVAAMFNESQQAALKSYIEAGGGYFGIHAASDANYDWDWYGQLVGAYFKQHPAIQATKLLVEDKAHPAMAGLGDTIDLTDELYDFRANPRANVHVLASLDQSSYTGSTMGNDHPIAWCQDYDGGRSAYNALGHDATNWSKPWFQQMILGGIETTAGVEDADCGASLAKNYEVVSLDDNTADPMMLDVAADGRVFYIEQYGLVKVINPTTHQTTQVANLAVTHDNESGLLGMALDPNFGDNGWMYVYYSPNAPGSPSVDRLSRFTVDQTTNTFVAGSEKVVLDVPVQRQECCHHGGSMVFDKSSGNLYLATGDNSNPFASDGYAPVDYRTGRDYWDSSRTSGNTNSLSGKVLRIHPEADGTYTVPAGNLFPAGTDKTKAEIFGMGFRNPFRINIDPVTHHLLVADYGPDAGSANVNRGPANTVEWNIVDTPGFYGWPFCTGNNAAYNRYNFDTKVSGTKYECATGVTNDSPHNTGLTTLPAAIPADIYYHYDAGTDWPEIGGGGAPMAGAVYSYDPANTSGTKWPAYWSGKPLLAEWNKNTLFSILTDSAMTKAQKVIQTTLHKLPAPDTRTIKLMDSKFGPDGSLYLIDWGSGWSENTDSGIYRIDYTAGDRAPIAKAAADQTDGDAPLTVAFSSAGSRDPDGDTISYAWNFGDGQTSTEANPTHTFAAGVYDVQLTVTDEGGRAGVSNLEITSGNHRPVVTIETPLDGQFFEFGDQLKYVARVTDAEDGSTEDGSISCDLVQEQSSLGHFSGGSSHAHPMGTATGCTATIQTLEGGGHGGDVWLYWVIQVSYTDKGNGAVPALTGSSTVILQTKHRQAEHFNNTGRISTSTSTGDPGVVVETTSDTAGGTQNIGYVEPGDWISFDKVNLSGISALSMRMAGTVGADFELRWDDPETGSLLGTVPAKPTSGWQVFDDSQTALSNVTDETGTLYLVAKKDGQTGSVVNVNWVDFIGKGATVNQRPDITSATVSPVAGTAPLTVEVAAAATDPEGSDVTYQWDLGTTAGEKLDGATGSFTYVTAGTYSVTLTVTDEQGSYNTKTFSVKVSPAAPACLGAKSDEFDGSSLDSTRWTVIRPDGSLTVSDGALHVPTAPADIYSDTNNAPNIVLQPMPSGPWEVTTKVGGPFYTAYQQAGLVVYGDDDNYAKLVFSGRSSSGDKSGRIIQFSHEQGGGAAQEANTQNLGADFPDTAWLRLTSDGENLTPSYSTDGITWIVADDSWTGWSTVRKSTAAFANPQVGLLSLANSGTAVDAAFDFFRLTPDNTAAGASKSDQFEGTALDATRWNVLRPEDGLSVSGGQLTIPITAKDLYQSTNNAGNLVLQAMPEGAWEVTTKVTGAMYTSYEQAGIVVYGDDENYAKLVFEGRSSSGDKAARIVQFSHEQAGAAQEANTANLGADFPDTVWLKLSSDGENLTPSYSTDGETWISAPDTASWSGWSTIRKSTAGFANPQVGLAAMAGPAAGPVIDAHFDFFNVTPDVGGVTGPDDEFDGSALSDCRWTVLRPDGTLTVGGGSLKLPVTATDLYQTTNNAPNLVVQDLPAGGWEAVTKVTGAMYTSYAQAGLLIYGDDDNYAKLVFEGRSSSGDKAARIIQFSHEITGTAAEANSADLGADFPDTVWLKLTSDGTNLTPSYSTDGTTWIAADSWDGYGTINRSHSGLTKIGLLATGAGAAADPVTAAFDFFHLTTGTQPSDDTTAPATTASVSGDNPAIVTLTAVDEDGGSGIAKIEYRINTQTWSTYTDPISVPRTASDQTIEFRATDKAGNIEATKSATITKALDNTAPVTTAVVSSADPAVVTLTAVDETGGSGVAKTEYRLGGAGDWLAYTSPVSVPRTDVDQVIEFKSTDVAGNVEAAKSATITKSTDTTAPETTATLDPEGPSGENGWWTGPVTLTLSATDAKFGVDKTEYALGDGQWQVYGATPVTIDVQGAQSVQFRSTDKAGNIEATKSIEVKIDTVAPETAANLDGDDPVTVTLIGSDETSGVASRSYRIGTSGDWLPYSGPFTVAKAAAAQTVQFTAADKAGNESAARSVVIAAKPMVLKPSVTGLSVSATSLPYGGVVTATVTVTSAGTVGNEIVSLYDGQTLIGAGVLRSGKATIKVEDLAVGTHPLSARFAGNGAVAESTSPAKSVSVVKAKAGVSVKASAIVQSYGTARPVTVTATVTLDSGRPAAGQVRFKDGSAVLATVPVISGKAKLKLSQTAKVGKHAITGQFIPSDTATTSGATSPAVSVSVVKAVSTTKLKASASTAKRGTPITFTATVALDTKQPPVGSVTFIVDGKAAKTVAVSASVAKYSYAASKVGKHTVKATFVPKSSAGVGGSTSSTATVSITK